MTKKKSINQLISENDDHLVGLIVSQCRQIMEHYPAVTKMTACYNLMAGVFRLFCVSGDPKELKKMAKEVHDGLIDEIR